MKLYSVFKERGRREKTSLNTFHLTHFFKWFVAFAKETMSKRQKDMLRKLLEFKFKKHPRYNLDDKRLKIIEKFVGDRVKELLGE